MDLIESTSSIENILTGIEKLLLPETNIVKVDFSDVFKFEIGLWSIEPKLELYTHDKAVFYSNDYKLNDRALISASIKTKQETPSGTTCNWYIDVSNKNIPLVENTLVYRKEPIYPYDMSTYSNYCNWSGGCFVLLDFPVDVFSTSEMGIYTNGQFKSSVYSRISFLNSRLLYLHNITDPHYSDYVIRYPSDLYKTVNLYVLSPKSVLTQENRSLSLGIVSVKREILEAFISSNKYTKTNPNANDKYLDEDFVVVNALASIEEAKDWFGVNFDNCIFISKSLLSLIDTTTAAYDRFSVNIKTGESKLDSTYANATTHYTGNFSGNANLDVLSVYYNLSPIPDTREL
jgi:hypothetical protein